MRDPARLRRTNPGPPVRMVHLGAGAFFRAHQAWFTHRANLAAPPGEQWGIAAFSGRSAASVADLRAQGGRYTVVVHGPAGVQHELVESIVEVHAGEDVTAWRRCFAEPAVAVVTLTVTEAGYRTDRQGGLDREDPDVHRDLASLRAGNTEALRTVPARLVDGLRCRRDAGLPGLAVVPCDNLAGNGPLVQRLLLEVAYDVDPTLARWIEEEVAMVSTTVDRITPGTTEEDILELAALTGLEDRACVGTEPFAEWVLQGDFPAGRPPWEEAGASFVDDIAPHEDRKLWLLNGAHSLLAYAAPIAGHATVDAAVCDPALRAWVHQWWDEASRHIDLPENELAGYRTALLRRFAIQELRHRLVQIAADGSHKLPLRVVPIVAAERRAGRDAAAGALTIAAWTAHLRGWGEPVSDAGAQSLRTAVRGVPAIEAVHRVLDMLGLTGDEPLARLVVSQLDVLESEQLPLPQAHGAAGTPA